MTTDTERGLLTSRDAGPVEITNGDGRSKFLLVGDHAGNLVPKRLKGLGISPSQLKCHIAFDLGIGELGQQMSRKLDAPFISQRYSRLVIDCNRSLDHPNSIATVSDGVTVPANEVVSPAERKERVGAIFQPYHEAIAEVLAQRDKAARPTIVVALHSFTPVFESFARPWHLGVLHGDGDTRFAKATLVALRRYDLAIGDNQPYRFDETDFTVLKHAIDTGRPYAELEIRQDMLADQEAISRMTDLLCRVLADALTAT